MKTSLLIIAIMFYGHFSAQIFEMKKTYTGSHFAFSRFNETGINQFVVQYNKMWANDIKTGFHQYDGNELGQTFTTSGFRVIWGKKDYKWTASSDCAVGFGKDKNEVEFHNGTSQIMNLRATSTIISTSFGVALKENKVWLEGLYSNNLGRVIIEYATIHLNGVESYGSEYKLNGLYKGKVKTMQLGLQTSYKHKKWVFYARTLMPVVTYKSDSGDSFVDERNTQVNPKDFPSDYESYVTDPDGHISRREYLKSVNFKGFSYGFGMFYLIGKDK